jgi:hypothetical protein
LHDSDINTIEPIPAAVAVPMLLTPTLSEDLTRVEEPPPVVPPEPPLPAEVEGGSDKFEMIGISQGQPYDESNTTIIPAADNLRDGAVGRPQVADAGLEAFAESNSEVRTQSRISVRSTTIPKLN